MLRAQDPPRDLACFFIEGLRLVVALQIYQQEREVGTGADRRMMVRPHDAELGRKSLSIERLGFLEALLEVIEQREVVLGTQGLGVVIAEDLYYSGNTVIVDHGGGLFTIYAHLSEISVEEGGEVESGGLIGLSGATGRVTGPHLHWGAKIGNRPFDPTALLDGALFEQ